MSELEASDPVVPWSAGFDGRTMKAVSKTYYSSRSVLSTLLSLAVLIALVHPPAALADEADEWEDAASDAQLNAVLAEMSPEEAARFIGVLEAERGITAFHSVSPGHIVDEDSVLDSAAFFWEGGYFTTEGNGARCAFAPVHLPQGVSIAGLVIWFRDNDPGADYTVEVRRKATATTAGAEVLAAAASSGSLAGVRVATDLTIVNGLVNNDIYAYYVSYCTPPFLSELHGIYLSFTQ